MCNSNSDVEYAGIHEQLGSTAGIAPSEKVLKQGERVFNDTELVFSGEWEFLRLLPRGHFYCNTSACAKDNSANACYFFNNAKRIKLYGYFSEDSTSAIFLIDSVKTGQVCAQKTSQESSCLIFDSGKLSEGVHKFKIVATKGFVIDYLICEGMSAPYHIDSRNGSYAYFSADFVKEANDLSKTGCYMTGQRRNAEFEKYFKGSYLRCFGLMNSEGAAFDVYLDGKKVLSGSSESSKPEHNALIFEIENLNPYEFHAVKLVLTNDGKFAAGYFETDCLDTIIAEMNKRTDSEAQRMRRHEMPLNAGEWLAIKQAAAAPETDVYLGDGLYSQIFERNIQYLLNALELPQWVRLKDPGRIWVDILCASNEGRMLGGMCNTLRYKEVPQFRHAVAEILKTIELRQFVNFNGYLMPYDSTNYKLWNHIPFPEGMRGELKNYDRAMFTKGMLSAGKAGFEDAYEMLRKFYNWFNDAKEYLPDMLFDGMAIQGSIAGPLVYHSPVGEKQDIVTNLIYYDMDWWLEMLAKCWPEAVWRFTLNRPHNYLLTSICALYEVYLATGYERHLQACLGAWRIYHDYFQIPGGAISIVEHFECRPYTYILANLPNSVFETCANVFWIDLNHRLSFLWPTKEIYAAEIEKSLYNVVFAAQGENGDIRYFNHVNGEKYGPNMVNTCCEIQETHLLGLLPQYIFSVSTDSVYVNQFAAAKLKYECENGRLEIDMQTDFPHSEKVSVIISAQNEGAEFTIYFRMPSWLVKDADIHLNGEKIASSVPGEYYALKRKWLNGDTVSFELPMSWRLTHYTGVNKVQGKHRYAFEYGPMLYALCGPLNENAQQSPDEPSILLDIAHNDFLTRLKRRDNTLCFDIEGFNNYILKPYYAVQEETFTCFPAFEA